MVLSKSLLIKGLVGLTTAGAGGACIYHREKITSLFSFSKKNREEKENKGVVVEGPVQESAPTEDERGIPVECKAKEVKKEGDQKTCSISSEQLKKIKFKDLDGVERTVTGLDEGSTISLRVEHTTESKYTNNRKYTFDNISGKEDVIVKVRVGEEDKEVKIEKDKESYFKENEGNLEMVETKTKLVIEKEKKMKEANGILDKLGLSQLKLQIGDFENDAKEPTKHKKKKFEFTKDDDLKKIQFKELGGGATKVEGLSTSGGKKISAFLDWTTDSTNFPKNMKFTFENTQISPNITLKDATGKKTVDIWVKTKTDKHNTFKVEDDQLVKSTTK